MASEENEQDTPSGRLIPLIDFNKYYPDPTPSALRWLAFKNIDGFQSCIVRRGRRVLIDEVAYFRWVRERHSKKSEE